MKKKLLALALGITTAFSAVPLMPAKALSPPIPGDVNLDWTISIADLVCMQKYLMGTGTIDNTFGLMTVDLNNDKRVDVFDYIELRKRVDEWYGLSKNKAEITCTFTRSAISMQEPNQYSKLSDMKEAVIKSVSELKSYLSPMWTITTDKECIQFDVVSEEVYNDYLERYTEDFFNDNVLLLNFLNGVDEYTFDSAQYDTSGEETVFEIKYHDSTDPNLHWFMPLPPYIAEVVVPKDLWTECSVKWTEAEKPFEITTTSDFTKAYKDDAITASYERPAIIKSSDELNTYLDGKFNTGVETSLKETYNDEFFNTNAVIIDLYYQGYHDDWVTSVDVRKNDYDSIVFSYDRNYINGFVDEGIQINQAVVKKSQLQNMSAISKKSWEKKLYDVGYSEVPYVAVDLYSIAEMNGFEMNDETIKCYSKDGEWVNSDEEMKAYLADVMSYEMAEYLFPELYSTDDIDIDTCLYKPWLTNWNRQSVYMWVDNSIIGSEYSLINSAYNDEQVTLTISSNVPISCMGGSFLHIIRTENQHSGKKVIENNINMSNFMPHTDGESDILQFGENVVMVNQYTFGNKNVADIYRLHLGGGPVQFRCYDYIGTVEFAEDYFPVKKEGEYISYGSGENVVMETGEYRITMGGNQLTITYKYSADSEYTEQTFNY